MLLVFFNKLGEFEFSGQFNFQPCNDKYEMQEGDNSIFEIDMQNKVCV